MPYSYWNSFDLIFNYVHTVKMLFLKVTNLADLKFKAFNWNNPEVNQKIHFNESNCNCMLIIKYDKWYKF